MCVFAGKRQTGPDGYLTCSVCPCSCQGYRLCFHLLSIMVCARLLRHSLKELPLTWEEDSPVAITTKLIFYWYKQSNGQGCKSLAWISGLPPKLPPPPPPPHTHMLQLNDKNSRQKLLLTSALLVCGECSHTFFLPVYPGPHLFPWCSFNALLYFFYLFF